MVKCVQKREAKSERDRKWREKVTKKQRTSEDPKFIFSQLQSTSGIWSSITRMEPLREFPHGDTFALNLFSRSPNSEEVLNTLRVHICVCECVCL